MSFLEERGLVGEITSFSGNNSSASARRALDRWNEEVGCHLEASQRPGQSSAIRAALIHEFKTKTRVLVSTESGAKGLNLQFCNCLVNFDLPWNPQRVEQRIGRIHRYGQKHDAVIVNFINLDNEAEQRVYDLLTHKLHLFEGLFGASDQILGTVVSALDFENRIHRLLDACPSPEERRLEFDRLGLEIDAETRKLHALELESARDIIASLDRDVQARLRLTAEELPVAMSHRDEMLLNLLRAESPVKEISNDGARMVFEWSGRRYHLGPPKPSPECGEPLDLEHPLIQRRLSRSARVPEGTSWRLESEERVEWQIYRLTLRGLEEEERLLVLGEGGQEALTRALGSSSELLPHEVGEWADLGLSSKLAQICREFEQKQTPRVAQLQQHLENRQKDLSKFFEIRRKDLEKKVDDAEDARRYARTPEEQRKTRDRHRRLRQELESLRHDSDKRLREVSREVSRDKQNLAKHRHVSIEAVRLFRVMAGPV